MTTELAMTLSYIGGFIAIALIALWTIYTYQATKRLSKYSEERKKIRQDLMTGRIAHIIKLLDQEEKRNIVDVVFEAVELQEKEE